MQKTQPMATTPKELAMPSADLPLPTDVAIIPTPVPSKPAAKGPAQKVLQEPTGAPAVALGTFLGATSSHTRDLLNATTAGSKQAEVGAKAALAQGAAQAGSVTTAGNIDAAKNANQTDLLNAWSGSALDPSSDMSHAYQLQAEAQHVKDALRPQIETEDQVAAWDDPLRWAVNQFTLPKLKQAYNAANAQERDATMRIAQKQTTIEAQQRIEPALLVDKIKQKAAFDAEVAAQQAVQVAASARQQAAHVTAQSVMQQMTMAKTSLDAQMEVARLFMQRQQMDGVAREDSAVQGVLDGVNTKLIASGARQYTLPEFKMLSPQQRSYLVDNARSLTSYGGDPGDSLRYLNGVQALPKLSTTNPAVFSFLGKQLHSPEFNAKIGEMQKEPGFQKLPLPEQQSQAYTAVAADQVKELADKKGVNSLLSANNPYKFKPENALLVPELAGNTFVLGMKASLTANPNVSVSDHQLLDMFVGKSMADPSKIPALSKELSALYQTGFQKQFIEGGASMVGYSVPESYTIQSQKSFIGSPAMTLNTWKPADLETYAMRQIATRKVPVAFSFGP
jgi:hypothetical protein